MLEPVELKNFLFVFFSSAGVILFGGAYAVCHALSVLRDSQFYKRLGLLSYLLLLICVVVLSSAAHFRSLWLILSLLLSLGYFWMPRFLIKLTQATHPPTNLDLSN